MTTTTDGDGVIISPPPIKTYLENIPDEMKCQKRWFNWGYDVNRYKTKTGKFDKVPIISDWNNPNNWVGFDQSRRVCEMGGGSVGMGFAMYGSGFICVDIDGIIKGGKKSDINRLLENIGSYTELSVYGNGIHAFFKGGADEFKEGKIIMDGCEHIDIFNEKSGRWIAVTGNIKDFIKMGVLPPTNYLWVFNTLNDLNRKTSRTGFNKKIEGGKSFVYDGGNLEIVPHIPEIYPPCVKNIIKKLSIGEGVDHSARVHLVLFLKSIRRPQDEVVNYFRNCDDFDENYTKYQISEMYKGKCKLPYDCDRVRNEIRVVDGGYIICVEDNCVVKNPIVMYKRGLKQIHMRELKEGKEWINKQKHNNLTSFSELRARIRRGVIE